MDVAFPAITDEDIDMLLADEDEFETEQPLVEIRDDQFIFNFDSTKMENDLAGLISSLRSIENSADHWRERALRAEAELRMRGFLGGD